MLCSLAQGLRLKQIFAPVDEDEREGLSWTSDEWEGCGPSLSLLLDCALVHFKLADAPLIRINLSLSLYGSSCRLCQYAGVVHCPATHDPTDTTTPMLDVIICKAAVPLCLRCPEASNLKCLHLRNTHKRGDPSQLHCRLSISKSLSPSLIFEVTTHFTLPSQLVRSKVKSKCQLLCKISNAPPTKRSWR